MRHSGDAMTSRILSVRIVELIESVLSFVHTLFLRNVMK